MQPIQPAQRVERPPRPTSPAADADSLGDDDDSDTTTESSYLMSERFQTLPWPSPATPRSGRESPIPLMRGMSPASSQQPTHTPESSLTAWSGAVILHNLGHGLSNNNNSTTVIGASGGAGASRTSLSRDITTFNLLRANSGRLNANVDNNAALTEANIALLRCAPSGGFSRRDARRLPQQNSGRPPKTHHTSQSPTRAGGPTGYVAAINKRWTNCQPRHSPQHGPLNESPVRIGDRDEGFIGATAAAAEGGGHVTAPHTNDKENIAIADKNNCNGYTAAIPTPREVGPSLGGKIAVVTPLLSPLALSQEADALAQPAPRQERAASGRPRRASSRHQAQVLPGDVGTTDTAGIAPAAPAPPPSLPPVPSPTVAAAAAGAPQRRARVSGPAPTVACIPVSSTSTATTTATITTTAATAAVGALNPAPTTTAVKISSAPAPAERAARALPKAVPQAPSQYLSGGRLVQAARRMPVGVVAAPAPAPSAAPPSKTPISAAPKASGQKSPLTHEPPQTQQDQMKSPILPVAAAAAHPSDAQEENAPATVSATAAANGNTNASADASSSDDPRSQTDPAVPDTDSLEFCSVHTMSPAQARQRRVSQQPPVTAESARTQPSTPASDVAAEQTPPSDLHRIDAASRKEAPTSPSNATVKKSGPTAAINTNKSDEDTNVNAEAQKDGRITRLLTVEVARLVVVPLSRTPKSAKRTTRSPAAAAAIRPVPPSPPLVSSTPTAPDTLALQQQPPSAVLSPAAATAAFNVDEAPKRTPATVLSGPPHDDADPLASPPLAIRALRSAGQPRHTVADSHSFHSTLHAWSVDTLADCRLSMASTQPPLSVQFTPSVKERSSSVVTSDHGERGSSFTSTASPSADDSTTEMLAKVTTTAAPQPPLLLSPPTSLPPSVALRARRSSRAVSGSAERMALTERRGSAPAQMERQRDTTTAGATTAAPSSVAGGNNKSTAPARHGRPRELANVGSADYKPVKPGAAAASGRKGSTTMVVGGRQLPRMFPSADDDGANKSASSEEAAVTAAEADGTDDAVEHTRRRALSLPASSLGHGTGRNPFAPATLSATTTTEHGVDRAGHPPPSSPVVGKRMNAVRRTEAHDGGENGCAKRPSLHTQGAGNDAEPRRARQPPLQRTEEAREKSGAPALTTSPVLSAGGQAEIAETAFQASPLRLPSLMRLPRTPTTAISADTSPTTLQVHPHFASSTNDADQNGSSGSGHETAKDSNAATLSGRHRPMCPLPNGGASSDGHSNTSSPNSGVDGTHSAGSAGAGGGEAASDTVQGMAKSFHKKAPRSRQRAPSVDFF
ncbi:hypothetical protein ABB37_08999 [Leptomonas pyrrhocoris]|uniref:Uncharacterized protein n=1 Tax=Leptomonas pyrrhocoris TaxID=157538 RepID=A0A0M9FRN1_LEPPY|nr:hypothetical protein ABB37_08999 [Leptomonas pyrrhocoris]KPA74670.1 hypothetical protein ABB37_08999 [Leptomonas pyrrhocoris]|eukprot:XP_015653109.1 hypothetical protein ABB37_08999 [Leptomonas pyrrhocoris]